MLPRSSSLVALLAACAGGTTGPALVMPPGPVEVVQLPLLAPSRETVAPEVERTTLSPPWSLTASDGSGLALTRVDARAVFEGPLAFTELHLYFHNPEDRVREGTFQVTLPQHAAISRFAMENDGQWMEAEVVEKQLARRAYDDILHRRQDPALLEKAAGNQFTAKVFPIAARASKHLVISYSQELPGGSYVLPLRGLPRTESIEVALAITGADGQRVERKLAERRWQPDRDFVASVDDTAQAVTAGGYVAAQVVVGERAAAREAPRGITVLVDTSASRALGYDSYVRSIERLLDGLRAAWGPTLPLQLVAFDQDAEEIFRGKANELGEPQLERLLARGAAGASDLGGALAWTARHAPLPNVLVVTDGVITAGDEGAELARQVAALGGAKVERLDVALAGGLRDETAMAGLVRAGLPRAGSVLDLDTDPVATAIAETVSLDVEIRIPGAEWVYPRRIPAIRAGTRATVYAKLAQPRRALDIQVDGAAQQVRLLGGTAPLVERAVAAAEIAELEDRLTHAGGQDVASLRAQIARTSVAARVLSSQTSLLVLESDHDYARYGIDRRALADVLVVNANGVVERHNRTTVALAAPDRAARPKPRPAGASMASEDLGSPGAATTPSSMEPRIASASAQPADGALSADDRAKNKADEDEDAGGTGASPDAIAAGHDAPPPPAAPPPPPAMRARAVRDAAQGEPSARREVASASQPRRVRSRPADADDEAYALEEEPGAGPAWPPRGAPPALTGELAKVMRLVATRERDAALALARAWQLREPGNVLALIALGEALEAQGAAATAARAYGSIIDLFPGRADMRRFAGERLSRLTRQAGDLVVDTFRRAVADRPDHLTGHRLLAYALLRAGKHADAFAAILSALHRDYRADSFAGGMRVLREDAEMIGAVYAAAAPARRAEIRDQLRAHDLDIATRASTRFVLYWETDANDVDFHIQDARGGHAFYSDQQLASGGELYDDVTTGYGPECFTIPGLPAAGPYRLSIDYYAQGPMGYGMGLLQVQRFDGKGRLTFEDRPYVIMNDHAYVDLGLVR